MQPLSATSKLYFSSIAFAILILISCSGVRTATNTTIYNDSVHEQFWTADWSPDDKWIAVGGVDSLLRIYHAKTLKLYKSFPLNTWIHAVKWHPDGKTLAVATLDRYVLLLEPSTDSITALQSPGGSRTVGWNYNGQLLAVADLEGIIKIWDRQGALRKTIAKEYHPDVTGRSYLGLDWHPSQNTFVATNFQITHFDTAGRELQVMEPVTKEAIVLCVAWHPSGAFFVVGDYGHNWQGENVPSLLHFWNINGRLMQSVPGSRGEYRNIAWNKEGTLLATASDVLRIWTRDGTLLHQSKADSSNYLWGIDWNSTNNKIVTSSRHKTIALWDSTAALLKRTDVRKSR